MHLGPQWKSYSPDSGIRVYLTKKNAEAVGVSSVSNNCLDDRHSNLGGS